MISLYYEVGCACCTPVRVLLAEKELPFRRRLVPEEGSADLERLGASPPALLDDSFLVTESILIAEYLEDAFPTPPMRPADARGRASGRMLLARVERELTRPIEELARSRAPHKRVQTPPEIEEALARWNARVGEDPHPFGAEFSCVHAWLLAALERAAEIGVASLPTHAHLAAFRERARARPRTALELGLAT